MFSQLQRNCIAGLILLSMMSVSLPAQTRGTESISEPEMALFFSPAGKYTEDDIAANGEILPALKFKGISASHNSQPKPGESVCPITLAKASPEYTWIIDGKTYQFCCPLCIGELVRLAKENPEKLLAPEEYIHR